MQLLIEELYELIKDHREDEHFMTIERVQAWIMQFKEEDREFLLAETIHIVKQRYLSNEAYGILLCHTSPDEGVCVFDLFSNRDRFSKPTRPRC